MSKVIRSPLHASDSDIQPLRDSARNMQQKFAFYSVSLDFTLIALAIHSFDPTAISPSSLPIAFFEISAWLLLPLSGLSGLLWLKYAPHHYFKLADLQELLNTLRTLIEGLEKEEKILLDKFIPEVHKNYSPSILHAMRVSAFFQHVHFWTLIIGIISLCTSRMLIAWNSAAPGP